MNLCLSAVRTSVISVHVARFEPCSGFILAIHYLKRLLFLFPFLCLDIVRTMLYEKLSHELAVISIKGREKTLLLSERESTDRLQKFSFLSKSRGHSASFSLSMNEEEQSALSSSPFWEVGRRSTIVS